MAELLSVEIPGGHGRMWAEKADDGKVLIHRHAYRGGIRNVIENYDAIGADGRSRLEPLTEGIALHILKQVASGVPYSSAFIIEENGAPEPQLDMRKTEAEHRWTSSGIKFWRHQEQMFSYRDDGGRTVVSSHISPEGACSLKCPYCSVTYRDTHSRIDYGVIEQYVKDLQGRGLKAVILTGGGEPTIYPKFNELVQWLKYDRQLSVALITNGTTKRIDDKTWRAFSWVRISLNVFDGWEEKIRIPRHALSPDCVVGCSMVYTSEHQATKEKFNGRLDILRRAAKVADNAGASYVRIQPNCILDKRALMLQHKALDLDLQDLGDARFFHQHKQHETPKAHVCHQAFFRPYLSEEKFMGTGQAGTVLPCDSVCLVDAYQYFAQEYHICHASQILDFMDGKLKMRFDPTKRCSGCVFATSVNALDDWKLKGADRFAEFPEPLVHEEFV